MTAATLNPPAQDLEVARTLLGGAVPAAAVVLGSGLGAVAEHLLDTAEIGYDDLKGMQSPTHVPGHAGWLVRGTAAGRTILAFQGRLHTYQGVSAFDAAYPVRLAAALGTSTVALTNAAGGIADSLVPGSLMLIRDHVNLLGDNPLRGWPGPAGGVPFIPMADAYDAELRSRARDVARSLGIELAEGVYAAVPGPSFETPAEVEALRRIGVDAVGMSTVPEVIAARALGMRVLGISLVTNRAGGSDLSHEEVLEAGREAERHLTELLFGILSAL